MSNTGLLDIGTAEAWARHQRKMRTQKKVSEVLKLMRSSRSLWLRLARRHGRLEAQIGDLREGVLVAVRPAFG